MLLIGRDKAVSGISISLFGTPIPSASLYCIPSPQLSAVV